MSSQRVMQVVHHMTFLQSQCLDYRQHPFRKATTGLAVTAKSILPPQHARTQNPLDMIRVKLSAPSVQPMSKSVDCERIMDLVGVGQGFKRALSLRYIPGWSQPSA